MQTWTTEELLPRYCYLLITPCALLKTATFGQRCTAGNKEKTDWRQTGHGLILSTEISKPTNHSPIPHYVDKSLCNLLNRMHRVLHLEPEDTRSNIQVIYNSNVFWNHTGRVLNGELYVQRLQKLIYLHLFANCFMKISPQSSEQIKVIYLNNIAK